MSTLLVVLVAVALFGKRSSGVRRSFTRTKPNRPMPTERTVKQETR